METETFVTDENTIKEDYLIYSGLLGIAAIVVIQLINQDKLSISLTISLYSFAVAIPALAANIFALTMERSSKITVIPLYLSISNYTGIFTALIGFGAVFFHFHWLIGVIFCSVSILCAIVIFKFMWLLEEINKDADSEIPKND